MDEFLKKIASILEVETVSASDQLSTCSQLDSLGILTVIAMLDATYGVTISTAELGHMNTFGDLWKHIQCMKGA